MKMEGLSAFLFVEIEGQTSHTVLYYGHLDKQPHMGGWDEDKGPTKPIIQNNRLYGRGSGDDGYAAFSAMLGVKAVQDQGIPLPNKSLTIQK
jgi:acetylornithine deacetylase/succinyl-diaminopimelate desuccinylase-like protein